MFSLVALAQLAATDELPHARTIMSDGEVGAQAKQCLLDTFMARAMSLSNESISEVQGREAGT